MADFRPKPWTNPFKNKSIFCLFQLLVFKGYNGVFSLYNIIIHIFLAYIALKREDEKFPIFDQNHGLTPLKKTQFFDFFNSLFV